MYGFEIQSIQRHLCLKLSIYTIKLHGHTPASKDVRLTGIHSIYHPEEQLLVVPIYEISNGFWRVYISRFPNFLPSRNSWNNISYSKEAVPMQKFIDRKRKRKFLGDICNSSIPNFPIYLPTIFRRIIWKFVVPNPLYAYKNFSLQNYVIKYCHVYTNLFSVSYYCCRLNKEETNKLWNSLLNLTATAVTAINKY